MRRVIGPREMQPRGTEAKREEPSMTTEHPTPYVPVEVVGGHLVRVCPECKQEIGERTDDEGIVSNNFAEHYEAEHHEQEPERQRYYVLGLQPRDDEEPGPGAEALQNLSHEALGMVRKQIPEAEWELVDRVEDLPEGAPALVAGEVIRGGWHSEGDDPQLRKIRWYRREGDRFVFTPTEAQFDEWDMALGRARDVRAAFIERHRDELPEFAGESAADWEKYYPELKRQEDEIAKEFDTRQQSAADQFYRGDYRWEATLEAAIADLGIPDEEVEELRARTQAKLDEAKARLRLK
jgi:hypothetical protein